MHSHRYIDNTIPDDMKELRALKLQITEKQLQLKDARHKNSILSSLYLLEAELIQKVKTDEFVVSHQLKNKINELEAELDIWTLDNILTLCRNYIKDVILRYKQHHLQNDVADENKLYEKSLDEFLFSASSLPRVLKEYFIEPLMFDIKNLNEITGKDNNFLYDVFADLLECFTFEFKNIRGMAAVAISGEDDECDLELEPEMYNTDEYPVWKYLLTEHKSNFDRYLTERNDTNYNEKDITDFRLKVMSRFRMDAIINEIVSEIDDRIAGKQNIEDLGSEYDANFDASAYSREEPSHLIPVEEPSNEEVHPEPVSHLIEEKALSLAAFTERQILDSKELLRDNEPLRQALSASYYYLTKEKTGWYHGAHGEKATRCFIRNIMNLEDKSLLSIQNEALKYIRGEGREYGKWYWDSSSGHHRRSRIAFIIDSGLLQNRESEIQNVCRQTPGILRFFNESARFGELTTGTRKELTRKIKRL